MSERRERGLHELVRFVGPSVALLPLLNIGISVLVARTLGPEGRGGYGVAITAITLLPAVLGFGLEYAIRFWSARGETDPHSLLRSASTLGLLWGMAVAGVALFGILTGRPSSLIPEGLGPAGGAALCACVVLSTLKSFWVNFLVGQERYGFATWGNNVATAIQLLMLAAVWQLVGMSLDAALVSLALQFLAHCLFFFAIAGDDLRRSLRARFLGRTEIVAMLRYGRWEWLGELLTQTNLRLNIFILAALGGMYETGIYTAVMGPASFLGLLTSPLSLVLTARTARRDADREFPLRVAGALRLVLAITVLQAFAAAAVADPILPWIFGERFAAGVSVFQLGLAGIVALSVIKLTAAYLAGAGRPEWNTRAAAVGAVFTVGLSLLLIPRFGANGAALAMSFANSAAAAFSVYAFRRVSGLGVADLLIFRSSDWTPLGRVLGIRLGGPR